MKKSMKKLQEVNQPPICFAMKKPIPPNNCETCKLTVDCQKFKQKLATAYNKLKRAELQARKLYIKLCQSENFYSVSEEERYTAFNAYWEAVYAAERVFMESIKTIWAEADNVRRNQPRMSLYVLEQMRKEETQ